MHLIINGYEFGQGLRILLWIGVPLTVFLTLLTTWFHYRSQRAGSPYRSQPGSPLVLSIEGMEEGGTFSVEPPGQGKDGWVDTERTVNSGEEDYRENMYRGILWMKEKYEQYRDLADQRYERLKEQLTGAEKKYEELLESVRNTQVHWQTDGEVAARGDLAFPRGNRRPDLGKA
jgi:hypothetical protein